jgi:hypothetical protein
MQMLRKIVLATSILAMASATAMARDCIPLSDAEMFATADEVFIGKVTGVIYFASQQDTVFEISRSLKGKERERAVVISHRSPYDVSFLFGYTYIVYANNINGELWTVPCSGTRLIGKLPEMSCGNVSDPYAHRSYREIAVITASSVALSLTLGVLVGAIKRRFTK